MWIYQLRENKQEPFSAKFQPVFKDSINFWASYLLTHLVLSLSLYSPSWYLLSLKRVKFPTYSDLHYYFLSSYHIFNDNTEKQTCIQPFQN